MSKATRMAGALEGFADTLPAYGFEPKPLRNTAAHLRALDASHRKLLEALESIKSKAGDPEAVYLIARTAIAAAKELT